MFSLKEVGFQYFGSDHALNRRQSRRPSQLDAPDLGDRSDPEKEPPTLKALLLPPEVLAADHRRRSRLRSAMMRRFRILRAVFT